MSESSEKRMFARFETEYVGVSKDTGKETVIWITDISEQGLGFRTKECLKEKERLLIELKVKGLQEPVAVRGSVVWTMKVDSSVCRVGFKADPSSWKEMKKVLETLDQ